MQEQSTCLQTKRIWPVWLICLFAALCLYASTANRGAQWQDSGYFILRAVTGESVNPLGLALTHPLHYHLSRLAVGIGFFEPAFAVTLVSSLAAAVAIANLFACVFALTRSWASALLVAASMAVAHTFWQLATVAETYAVTAALLTAECWCLITFLKSKTDGRCSRPEDTGAALGGVPNVRPNLWAFAGMWLCNGLSFSNHNLALLTLPALAVATAWALGSKAIRPRWFAIGGFLWLLGAALYLQLIFHEASQSGDWTGTLQSAMFGRSYGDEVLSTSISIQRMLINVGFVILNFPNLFLPAAAAGLWTAWAARDGRRLYWPLFLGLFVHALFACRYPVADQHFFFLPTYIFLALFAGIAFSRWTSRTIAPEPGTPRPNSRPIALIHVAATLILLTPMVYAMVPLVARRFDTLKFFARNKPYRDDYAYLFIPWSVTETSADRMSREAMGLAGERGVIIVEDRMAEFAIRYQLETSRRRDVTVSLDVEPKEFVRFVDEGRPVVLVPRNADQPTTLPLRGSWRRKGDLYVFEP